VSNKHVLVFLQAAIGEVPRWWAEEPPLLAEAAAAEALGS
jgi:hypothetical protein